MKLIKLKLKKERLLKPRKPRLKLKDAKQQRSKLLRNKLQNLKDQSEIIPICFELDG
jgi:hypothetical protein